VPSRLQLWGALGTIYFVWGSTYVAIKVSVETLPPFLSAGLRFFAAALILAAILALARRRIVAPVREILAAAGLGVMLLALGVGVVTAAETRIDASLAGLIVGSVPLQVLALRALAGETIASATRIAAIVGLVGLALVVIPTGAGGGSTLIGVALMLGATASWSFGSFVSGRLPLPRDPFAATIWEMLGGSAALLLLGTITGEWGDVGAVSTSSALAWAYLVVAGSLVGFTAYAWLLRHAPISQVVTHQYVNPLVAVALGALLLGERLTPATAVGAVLVIVAVFVTVRRESLTAREEPERPAATRRPAIAGTRGTRAGRSG
jgi:drug/metabolite transporter (DMT)-like permease